MEQLLLGPTDQETHPAEWLTENILLALLGIPQEGLLGVTSALLFAEQQQLCAYWWRDEKGDGQHPKLVDPQVLHAAIGKIPIDTGFLPEHVMRLGISRKGQYWMLISHPPPNLPAPHRARRTESNTHRGRAAWLPVFRPV